MYLDGGTIALGFAGALLLGAFIADVSRLYFLAKDKTPFKREKK